MRIMLTDGQKTTKIVAEVHTSLYYPEDNRLLFLSNDEQYKFVVFNVDQDDCERISRQLLEKGFADLTEFDSIPVDEGYDEEDDDEPDQEHFEVRAISRDQFAAYFASVGTCVEAFEQFVIDNCSHRENGNFVLGLEEIDDFLESKGIDPDTFLDFINSIEGDQKNFSMKTAQKDEEDDPRFADMLVRAIHASINLAGHGLIDIDDGYKFFATIMFMAREMADDLPDEEDERYQEEFDVLTTARLTETFPVHKDEG